MNQSIKVNKENNFAILHFLGACLVVYGHQYALLGGSAPGLLGNPVSTIGVKMIFVITGFLITQSFLRSENLSNFLIRRLIRIFPALIGCVLLSTVCFFFISQVDLATYLRGAWIYIWHNILLYPNYTLPGVFTENLYPNAVNGSLWTIPVEVFTYFVIGLSLYGLIRLKNATNNQKAYIIIYSIFVFFFVALEAYKDVMNVSIRYVVWGTDWAKALDVMPYMMIGSLYSVADLKKYCNLQIACLILLASCCISCSNIELINFIVIPYFTMSFALCEKPFFSGWFEKHNIAYGVFLWGFPIQQAIVYLFQIRTYHAWSPNIFFILSMIPTIIAACLSHRFIENPIEGFLKRKLLFKKI